MTTTDFDSVALSGFPCRAPESLGLRCRWKLHPGADTVEGIQAAAAERRAHEAAAHGYDHERHLTGPTLARRPSGPSVHSVHTPASPREPAPMAPTPVRRTRPPAAHGTASKYNAGCRCTPCAQAVVGYERRRALRADPGDHAAARKLINQRYNTSPKGRAAAKRYRSTERYRELRREAWRRYSQRVRQHSESPGREGA